jgi:serine/threonine-protein phosphatase PP1 catalytic subunit
LNLNYEQSRKISSNTFSAVLEGTRWILEWERSTGKIRGGKINSGLLELGVPENLVIVGDIHGDFCTLQKILVSINSVKFLSNPNNKLIFLGDYIDRGSNSIDVLYTIMYLKSSYPDSVVLMRGNHEAPLQFPFSSHILFSDLKREFPATCSALYEKILSIFELFTLMTVVDHSLLLVHGGVPVSNVYKSSKPRMGRDLQEKRVMEEILWNDPRDSIKSNLDWEKSRRSFGNHFGEKVSRKWLSNCGARVIVRGHEPCQGVMVSHSDHVLTLFSSKEAYPDFQPAFISLSGRELCEVRRASDMIKHSVKLT